MFDKDKTFNSIAALVEASDGKGWMKGWRSIWGRPINPTTGKQGRHYRGGANMLALLIRSMTEGEFRFCGMSQAMTLIDQSIEGATRITNKKKKMAMLRKGSKATWIACPIPFSTEDKKTGETRSGVRFAWRKVFPVTSFVGFDELLCKVKIEVIEYEHDRDERAEAVVASLGIKQIEAKGKACYAPRLDTITMPPLSDFENLEEYYWTLFHEYIHATGHASRLDREGIKDPRFGTDRYASEELVAELGAWFLAAMLGLDAAPNQANAVEYMANWMQKFKQDPEILGTAAGKAWKAVEHILNRAEMMGVYSPDVEQTTCDTAVAA